MWLQQRKFSLDRKKFFPVGVVECWGRSPGMIGEEVFQMQLDKEGPAQPYPAWAR